MACLFAGGATLADAVFDRDGPMALRTVRSIRPDRRAQCNDGRRIARLRGRRLDLGLPDSRDEPATRRVDQDFELAAALCPFPARPLSRRSKLDTGESQSTHPIMYIDAMESCALA